MPTPCHSLQSRGSSKTTADLHCTLSEDIVITTNGFNDITHARHCAVRMVERHCEMRESHTKVLCRCVHTESSACYAGHTY